MNRHVSRNVLFHGVIGVIATILSAWLCQFIPRSNYDATPLAPGEWPFTVPTDWPVKPDSAMGDASLGFDGVVRSHNIETYALTRRTDPTVAMHSTVERLYGLPLRSLQRVEGGRSQAGGYTPVTISRLDRGAPMPRLLRDSSADRERLATRPVVAGFVINTLFYGVLSWLLYFGFARTREKRRRRAGRCIRCGYNLTGNNNGICPECGELDSDRQSMSSATS
jgi:hypothetical protein